jgi:hypothetical protein
MRGASPRTKDRMYSAVNLAAFGDTATGVTDHKDAHTHTRTATVTKRQKTHLPLMATSFWAFCSSLVTVFALNVVAVGSSSMFSIFARFFSIAITSLKQETQVLFLTKLSPMAVFGYHETMQLGTAVQASFPAHVYSQQEQNLVVVTASCLDVYRIEVVPSAL